MIGSRDTALGLVAIAIAAGYYHESTKIQQSLLSDGVGADGLPRVLAAGLALTGIGLVLRSLLHQTSAPGRADPGPHIKAAELVTMLAAAIAIMPYAGYLATISILIGAIALYAGARPTIGLALAAVGGAAIFWAAFQLVLAVPMPTGVLKWI